MSKIMNSVGYQKGRRLGDIEIDDISGVIKQPETFVWVGLHEPDETLLRKVQAAFGLHELSVEDARKAHQRPKIESYGDSLFIVLKTAQLELGRVIYGETHLFAGANFLVTVRHGPSPGYTQVRERCESEAKMLARGPGFALYALLDFVVDNYLPIVGQFEKDFDDIEEDIFKGEFDKLAIERLYDLKRQLLELRNAALPVTDISAELVRFHEHLIPKELRAYFRDVQDHVSRLVGLVDGMREMLTTAMQVNLALVGHSQNEVVKRLAGWGAILAVPTVVFSLYGMNFAWMPELQWQIAYPAVLGTTLVGSIFLYYRLRRARWL
ncbi:MAG: magnesium and cobalt transport protein CorA [Bryobacterales bacterium]|nr:magnesium and cobalt transport protein CorA [Bryobacterales bacterium]